MKNNIAIHLSSVSKKYLIHHEKPTLVERILNGHVESFFALKDITLSIKRGEKVGLIGTNGSGKTTLLKLITGIASPTKGKVKTVGKIVSLIDLEAGFHPDLTGIQNIYLNGMVLGLTKSEISGNLEKIVKFADIGSFIDTPLFTYSQGMKVRLGFAVAVHSNPDILILDENLAMGDKKFYKICQKQINDFFKAGKTIIVASHDLEFIKRNCERVVVIQKGKILKIDKPEKAIPFYLANYS